MTTRWRKLVRDVQDAPGRLVMIVAALAVSLTAVVAMLATFTVLRREVPRSYLASNPASARLELAGDIPDDVLRAVRARPDVAMADVAGRASAQLVLGDGETLPVLLFVVPAFSANRVDAVHAESASVSPGDGVLIERSALALTRATIGDSLLLILPTGGRRRVRIAGTVHDPGVAPAWQEQVIYAYATQSTMQGLGEPVALDQLKLVARDSTAPTALIDAMVHDITDTLASQGLVVRGAQVPPVRQHPHQPQMNAIIVMLLMFSLLGMVLGTVLTATVISGMLAQQVRQIAIMKAVGARSAQLRTMYLALVGTLGVVSVGIALPLGIVAGRGLVMVVAKLLNLRIESLALPWWVFASTLLLGIVAPMLATLLPVQRATRRTVREAIDDHGARTTSSNADWMSTLLARLHIRDIATTLAARNAVRRPGRLVMTAGLLAGAGAMFIASFDLKAAWEEKVSSAARDRMYDLEIHLREAVADSVLARVSASLPGVDVIENWSATGAVRVIGGDTSRIGRVHADGGHGALTFRAAVPVTRLIAHRMTAGRWLQAGDTNAVVINSMATELIFPDVTVGARITLRVNDSTRTFVVVGLMAESLTQSTAYVTAATFGAHTGMSSRTSTIRVRLRSRGREAVATGARRVTQALETSAIPVRRVVTSTRMAAAQGGHVYILIAALALIAVAMAIVGLIGLTSALGISVLERTREFGVMRAIGASRAIIVRSVLVEGLCMALLSLVPALIVSRALSRVVGGVLASVAQQDLVLSLSVSGVVTWSVTLCMAAAAVSALPASRAAGLTVREAITST